MSTLTAFPVHSPCCCCDWVTALKKVSDGFQCMTLYVRPFQILIHLWVENKVWVYSCCNLGTFKDQSQD